LQSRLLEERAEAIVRQDIHTGTYGAREVASSRESILY
jgi:hypothetical protein